MGAEQCEYGNQVGEMNILCKIGDELKKIKNKKQFGTKTT